MPGGPVTALAPSKRGASMTPRHLRNPRRAYDQDGRELKPMTALNAKAHGARGITAHCACDHEAVMSFRGGLHPD